MLLYKKISFIIGLLLKKYFILYVSYFIKKITLKGVTKNIKLNLENGGALGKKAGFTLSGKINRSEFGVTWNKVLETGGVAVSDEVKLNIDIQGNLTN